MKMRSPPAVVRPHLTLLLRGSLPLRPGGGAGRGEVGRRAELRQRALRSSFYFRGSEAIQRERCSPRSGLLRRRCLLAMASFETVPRPAATVRSRGAIHATADRG